MPKLCIALVGLPARGKSFVAARLQEGLEADGIKTEVFNNGRLRRAKVGPSSTAASFYHPENTEGIKQREELAMLNMHLARSYLLKQGGDVAILDATNSSRARRAAIEACMDGISLLFIECINNDPELLNASVESKTRLPEFASITPTEARQSFWQRIRYYETIFTPLAEEKCFAKIETLNNRILHEQSCSSVPYYTQIKDILMSDWVRNMYLARHGQSLYNLEDRIGGDSGLSALGHQQSEALARHFAQISIPYIFTSTRLRSAQTAAPIIANHPESIVIALPEFDEIDAGIFETMTYAEIKRTMPKEFKARSRDKYGYTYPQGEGYASLKERVATGFRKALFLSGATPGFLVIGHQAINRTILSLFLYRRDEAVPHIYVPQNEYFHIVATHRKKLVELVRFMD